MAKQYFREKGIRFKDVDVSRDAVAARDMMRRSGQQGIGALNYTLLLMVAAVVVAFVGLIRGFSARAGTQ